MKRLPSRNLFIGLIFISLCGIVVFLLINDRVSSRIYHPSFPDYIESSSSLQDTTIAATIDEQIKPGKSMIWCASLQLAWKQAQEKLFRAPIRMNQMEELCAKLNSPDIPLGDISPDSTCLQAGLLSDGIAQRVDKEMARKFPTIKVPGIDRGVMAVSYAFLNASIDFTSPYLEYRVPLVFKESSGRRVGLTSFGLRSEDRNACQQLRKQARVLFARRNTSSPHGSTHPEEFAIDPCRASRPYQIVMAIIKPEHTLSEAFSRAQLLSSRYCATDNNVDFLGPNDELQIPNMNWNIIHRFEGIGGRILNREFADKRIEIIQQINFILDRNGAALESASWIGVLSRPTLYVFDRPFLIYMKKRDSNLPFFMMWVDNAELMKRFPHSPLSGQ